MPEAGRGRTWLKRKEVALTMIAVCSYVRSLGKEGKWRPVTAVFIACLNKGKCGEESDECVCVFELNCRHSRGHLHAILFPTSTFSAVHTPKEIPSQHKEVISGFSSTPDSRERTRTQRCHTIKSTPKGLPTESSSKREGGVEGEAILDRGRDRLK